MSGDTSFLKGKCGVCGKEQDHDCVCQDCVLEARESYLLHFYNHHVKQDDCNLCTLGFSVNHE